MKNSRPTQCDRLYDYLMKHRSITVLDAFMDLGISRLSARIYELKHNYGIDIDTRWITVKNRHGEKCSVKEYYLVV